MTASGLLSRRVCTTVAVASTLWASWCCAGGDETETGRAFELAVGPVVDAMEEFAVGDVQPAMRALLGVEARLRYRLGGLVAGVSGTWGADRVDVAGGVDVVGGRVESVRWRVGALAGRAWALGERTAIECDLEGWYGEDQAWVKGVYFPYDGPHTITAGGAVACEGSQRVASRTWAYFGIGATVYEGRATQAALVERINWSGGGVQVRCGVKWVVLGKG